MTEPMNGRCRGEHCEAAACMHAAGFGLDVLGVRVAPMGSEAATGTLFWSGSDGPVSVIVAHTEGVAFGWVVRRSHWDRGMSPERVYRGEAATLDEAVARAEADEDLQAMAVAS